MSGEIRHSTMPQSGSSVTHDWFAFSLYTEQIANCTGLFGLRSQAHKLDVAHATASDLRITLATCRVTSTIHSGIVCPRADAAASVTTQQFLSLLQEAEKYLVRPVPLRVMVMIDFASEAASSRHRSTGQCFALPFLSAQWRDPANYPSSFITQASAAMRLPTNIPPRSVPQIPHHTRGCMMGGRSSSDVEHRNKQTIWQEVYGGVSLVTLQTRVIGSEGQHAPTQASLTARVCYVLGDLRTFCVCTKDQKQTKQFTTRVMTFVMKRTFHGEHAENPNEYNDVTARKQLTSDFHHDLQHEQTHSTRHSTARHNT